MIGDELFEDGAYQEAIQSYNDFLKLRPRHAKTIYNRGRCYQELGEYEKAVQDFNKVIDLEPKHENALLSLGQEKYRIADYKSSTFYCEKVLEINKSNAMAHYLNARSHHKQGLLRDAMNDYNSAINLDPQFGEAYLHRSALYLYMKRKAAACKDLNKAVHLGVKGAKAAQNKNC